jgi:hypothetical protein
VQNQCNSEREYRTFSTEGTVKIQKEIEAIQNSKFRRERLSRLRLQDLPSFFPRRLPRETGKDEVLPL